MGFFRGVTLGFGAGVFGGCVLFAVAYLFNRLQVPQLLGFQPLTRPFPAGLYQLLVWGGIWGVLVALPILNRMWWLKGILIGLLATAAIAFYFNPAFANAPPVRIAYAAVLNAIWGIAAAWWWSLVSGTGGGRRFGGGPR